MNRSAASMVSVLLAYGICAASGVNKWMYVWLKGFYASYVVCMWLVFTVTFLLFVVRAKRPAWTCVGIGAVVGYFAGVLAYQIAPAARDGSFVRITTTVATQGVATYAATSALYPLLCLAPLVGIAATLMFMMMTEKTPRYVAAAVVGAMFVVGWGFFLSHGVLPARW
jgi:hypothetical protein